MKYFNGIIPKSYLSQVQKTNKTQLYNDNFGAEGH